MSDVELNPTLLLSAYAAGIFPMAEQRDSDEVFWVDPVRRGIIPLSGFRMSRSLRRTIRRGGFEITFDTDFAAVLSACAARQETWINETIRALYLALHRDGHAHSVEVWRAGTLVGGAYGVAIGGAFFGESMFSAGRDGSKIALVYLVDRLRRRGFTLLDTQFVTDHLASLGAIEISRGDYRIRLAQALEIKSDFAGENDVPTPDEIVEQMTQQDPEEADGL